MTPIRLALSAAALCFACSRAPSPPEVWTEPETGMVFVRLAPGEFEQGSPENEPGHEAAETLHPVRLTRAVFLGRTEVTQGQWRRVMKTSPSHFQDCGDDCPVENVNALEIDEFLERLRVLAGGGSRFRLPTEAEWEYACRAGTRTPFAFGANLTTEQANFNGRFPYAGQAPGIDRGRPLPVGSLPANAWGLFDLHGNVWEWTADEFCPYPAASTVAVDPLGRCGAPLRVIRGGSWYFNADSARCAVRYTHRPVDRGFSLGFRVAREVSATAPETAAAPAPAVLPRPTPPPPPPAQRPAAGGSAPLIVFLGDSLAAGYGLAADEAFPSLIGPLLAERGLAVRVVNAGVSGDTSAGGLARLGWLLRQKPDILVVELGGNDGLRGLPVEMTERNLRQILIQARAAGAVTVLAGMQMPANYGPEYTSGFAAIYPRLAREEGAILVPFLLEGVAGIPELNLPDGIHPTAEGHRRVAALMLPYLERALEALEPPAIKASR